jgi:hypothetical protein
VQSINTTPANTGKPVGRTSSGYGGFPSAITPGQHGDIHMLALSIGWFLALVLIGTSWAAVLGVKVEEVTRG